MADDTPEAPCAGGELQIEQVAERCRTEDAVRPLPGPALLSRAIADPGPVRAGSVVQLDVRLENVTQQPLRIITDVMDRAGLTGRPRLLDAAGHDAQDPERGDGWAVGALIDTHPIDVTLMPGGALTFRVSVNLRRSRITCIVSPCRELLGDPLAPGVYRAVINTPLFVHSADGGSQQLVLEREITVTP